MKTLQEKIRSIKDEANSKIKALKFEHELIERFKDYDIKTYGHRVVFKFSTIDEIIDFIVKHPPTNKQTILGFAGKQDRIIESPFRLQIQNKANPSEYFKNEVKVEYKLSDIRVELTVPSENCEFLNRTSRHITDSEYVHFIGRSVRELQNIKVLSYEFKNSSKVIKWYGGDITLLDVEQINLILKQ